jgi:DNA-binding HxlR family transcriptional regulator
VEGIVSRNGYVKPDVLNQNCQSRQALELISDKWTALIVYALVDGPRRHGELRRTIDGISQKMLTQTLRRMEAEGLIERDVLDRVPPHVEYSLTTLGRTLEKPLVAICEWAMEHLDELRDARAVYAGAGGR